MINIPGNSPVRRPNDNNRVKRIDQVKQSDETATTKPAKDVVVVERRRNPDRRKQQTTTANELRSRHDRRRARRIDIEI